MADEKKPPSIPPVVPGQTPQPSTGQTFTVVAGPHTPYDADPLRVEWRSCLLRAARRGLLELEGELERHRNLDSRYAQAVIDATQMEMDCLQAGIAWLWRQTA